MDRREQRFKKRTAVTKEQPLNFLRANDAADQNREALRCGDRNSHEISLRTLCDLIRYQQLKEFGIVHSAKEFIQLFHPNEQEDTP